MGPLKSGRQLAAARAFAGMDRAQLAAARGLSPGTIKRLEQGGGVAVRSSTLDKLEAALLAVGVRSTLPPGGVPKPPPPMPKPPPPPPLAAGAGAPAGAARA